MESTYDLSVFGLLCIAVGLFGFIYIFLQILASEFDQD